MFSVVARLGVDAETRDAGLPVELGVEAELEGFATGVAGVGLAVVCVFRFCVV